MMASKKEINDPKSVSDFIEKLDPPFAKQVELVRQIILSSDTTIGEHIKWNAPSFFYTGEMQPFDPKTYKRDIVVMHLRKSVVMLIFPTGEIINDSSNFLEGNYADGRRLVTFKNLSDIRDKEKKLQITLRQWLKLIDK